MAAARDLTGHLPAGYIGDSSDPEHVRVRPLAVEARRLFWGEAMNPKFLIDLRAYGEEGAHEMAYYLERLCRWDERSEIMEDWMYETYAEKYALDPKVQDWMRKVNPWALHRMAETLLEAQQRGLWNASEETLAELRSLYLSIEGDLEERAEGAQ